MANKSFDEVYRHLISEVYEDDLQSQQYYLSVVESQRKIATDYLFKRKCLFIPNDKYIHYYIGDEADQFNLELYRDGSCLWCLYLLLPIVDLSDDIVGVTGWDAYHKYQEQTEDIWGLSMYKVSSKVVFEKEKYFLTDIDLLRNTFKKKRVVVITDGVFDSVSLSYRGIPAIALLGSTFSREVLYFLSWMTKIYVAADNDDAGKRLYDKLRRNCGNKVFRIYQSDTKDIEEYLRRDGMDSNGPISKKIKESIFSDVNDDVYLDTLDSHKYYGRRFEIPK